MPATGVFEYEIMKDIGFTALGITSMDRFLFTEHIEPDKLALGTYGNTNRRWNGAGVLGFGIDCAIRRGICT
jgi:hypothetical protein